MPGDKSDILKNTYEALLQLPAAEIAKWFNYQEFYMKQADQNNLVLAALVLNGYVSDDSFTDFRAWLIMQGRSVYHNALRQADSLADVDVAQGRAYFEEYGYVAIYAYSAKAFYKAAEGHLRSYLAKEDTRAFVDAVIRREALCMPRFDVAVPADPALKQLRRYIKERFAKWGSSADVYEAADKAPLTQEEKGAVLAEIEFEKSVYLPRLGHMSPSPQLTPRLCQKYDLMRQVEKKSANKKSIGN